MAMNFFDSKGIKYEVYDADDPKIFSEMLERNPAARTVPQIFIDDDLIGGYTDLIDKYSE
jgi:thioredoxin reductase (NADPH)